MSIPEGERPEAVQKRIHEALGVRLFTPAPEGFDPIEASARELLVHGYPARPDEHLHPELHKQWTQVMSRPMTVIEPQFAVMRNKAHGPRQFGLPAGNGWAGSVAFAAKGDTVTFVSGQWTVPHVVAPKAGSCICATWVGIDGANDDPSGNDSYDILQAGTTQMIVAVDYGSYHFTDYFSFVWFEWYPAYPVEITNLPASPGDTMYCTICVYSPTEAAIHLLNVTSGVRTSFTQTAPDNTQLVGNCAEWVVECPVSSNMNLARYGDIYFDNCVAGTQDGKLLFAGTGSLQKMYDVNGHYISIPQAETNLLIKVEYTDASP